MRIGIVVGLLIAMAMSPAFGADGASIRFDATVKDAGSVLQGTPVRQVFAFTNEGKGTLEITGVEHTCGCESSILSAKKIAPGKDGRIEIRVKTENLSGLVEKHVVLTTNDVHNGTVSLTVRMEVVPEIDLSESMIFFDRASRRDSRKEIVLTVRDPESVRIVKAESKDARVAVSLEPEPNSGGKKTRLVALWREDGRAKSRDDLGEIVIRTTSSRMPEIVVYVLSK